VGRMGIKRAVIVIDEDGIVRHRHDHLLGLDYQSVDDLKVALDALPARLLIRTRVRYRSVVAAGLGRAASMSSCGALAD
jgi:hypothetical protein